MEKKLRNYVKSCNLRFAIKKMGPVITDNGNFILDVDFGLIINPKDLNEKILRIPGIVDTGFFIDMASKIYIGQKNGEVLILKK